MINKKYKSLHVQRNDMLSIMKNINSNRERLIEVIESCPDEYSDLFKAEEHMIECISHIGNAIGITISTDISEGIDVSMAKIQEDVK